MATIKILESMAGLDFSYPAGSIQKNVPPERARDLVGAGIAEYVHDGPLPSKKIMVEKATAPIKAETADLKFSSKSRPATGRRKKPAAKKKK